MHTVHAPAGKRLSHHFLLRRDAQHVELVEDPEEGQHHAHGPAEDE